MGRCIMHKLLIAVISALTAVVLYAARLRLDPALHGPAHRPLPRDAACHPHCDTRDATSYHLYPVRHSSGSGAPDPGSQSESADAEAAHALSPTPVPTTRPPTPLPTTGAAELSVLAGVPALLLAGWLYLRSRFGK
jgi:hypothetical protein